MEIHTTRLLLREYIADDLEAILAFESDPMVVQYVCYGPYSREECWQDLANHIDQQTAVLRTHYHLGIILTEEAKLIGWCGLEMINRENREAEIGYALHRAYWGHGYMTEAARAILQAGFTELQLHRIFATCHPDNVGSIRVLERLGMRYEGCLRKQKWCRNGWRDVSIYSLLEEEWQT
jgi:RimJ/RimL family protein N-acetyltransferase